MTKKRNHTRKPSSRGVVVVAGVVAMAALAWLMFQPKLASVNTGGASSEQSQPRTDVSPQSQPAPVAASASTATAAFQLRPLAVARETATHQWTAEDARDTNVIRQLAHNDLEYQRMVEENTRIQRRQLVYRKDTAAAVLQRALLTGEPVGQLTLPGFDGQELQFTIDRSDLELSKQSGSFTGHLAGRPGSLVTLAFKFGREAFTILSSEDGVYLQAHPREPGELIITKFDPEAYQPMPGGEPIVTSQK